MRRNVLPVRVLLLSSLFAIAGPAWGQDGICSQDPDDDDCVFGGIPFEIPPEFRDPATANSFSLSPPGARSLAMGGAFLGLADDATAAYTNPAGLTNLAVGGAEVTVEVRGAQYSSSFADRGHYKNDTSSTSGPDLTHTGQDFVDGLQFGKADGYVTGLSFLSYGFVLPGGLTVALYRHELGNFQSSFEAQGPFNDDNCGAGAQRECELFRVQPSRSSIDMEIIKNAQLIDFELYNLREDLGQKKDLAKKEPERLAQLKAMLVKKYREVQKEGPTWQMQNISFAHTPGDITPDAGPEPDAGNGADDDGGGCGCAVEPRGDDDGSTGGGIALGLLAFFVTAGTRRRRRT